MECPPGDGERINAFALVSYIPEPLGSFLDRLRQDLDPSCLARAHVTILPPRTIQALPAAIEHLRRSLHRVPPFEIELRDVEVFESTSVVYLGIGKGTSTLRDLHGRLNAEELEFDEPFEFHPHVTIAQNFPPAALGDVVSIARERWREFDGPREFCVRDLCFVQNTVFNRWLDLERLRLDGRDGGGG
jgi:2'-5' RNA ligase